MRRYHWGRIWLACAVTVAVPVIWYAASQPSPFGVRVRLRSVPEIHPAGTVIRLYTSDCEFQGSACVVGHRNGRTYLLTADHVIAAGAVMCDRGELRIEVRHGSSDLAIASVPDTFGRAFLLGESLEVEDRVHIAGYLLGSRVDTWGRVANAELRWFDCHVGPGMSGGAVMDDRGRLVGVVSQMMGHGVWSISSSAVEVTEILKELSDAWEGKEAAAEAGGSALRAGDRDDPVVLPD